MAQTAWPTRPFYIRSIIGDQYYALQPDTSNSTNATWQPFNPSAQQLWVAIPNGIGGAVLVNMGATTNNTLQYPLLLGVPTLPIVLAPLAATANGQSWILRSSSLTYADSSYNIIAQTNGVIALATALNVLTPSGVTITGVDEISDNEGIATFLLVEEAGQFFVSGLPIYTNETGTGKTNVSGGGDVVVLDNTGGATTPLTATITLSYTDTSSTTLTQSSSTTNSTTKTASLKVGGIIKQILSIDATGTISTTTSTTVTMEMGKTQTSSTTFSIAYNAQVPAGSKYQYQVETGLNSLSADISVPVMVYSSIPGATPYTLTVSAQYLGINTTASNLVVTQLSSTSADDSGKPEVVARIPIAALARTKISEVSNTV